MKKKISTLLFTGAWSVSLLAQKALAQAPQNESVELTNPLAAGNDLESVLKTIGDWLILIATPIAIFMILVGAFWILVSGGEPDKIKKGKQTILWTLIGYAILLLGTEIANLISGFFSQ